MTQRTKDALTLFSLSVADAIARSSNGKDVEWRAVFAAQEKLDAAIQAEPETATPPPKPEPFGCGHTGFLSVYPAPDGGTECTVCANARRFP